MTEQKEETVLLNPELREDDIPYDIAVDPDDELGDAKKHVRHAESRIHALRARLKHRKPRETSTMTTMTEFGTSDYNTTSTTTTTSTTVIESEITEMRTRLLELERIIKEKNEVTKDYQKQMALLSGQDGTIANLRSGKAELELQLSSAAEQLTLSREKTMELEKRFQSMSQGTVELSKLRQENLELQETFSQKELQLKSQTDANAEQLQEISDKNTELLKLKEQSGELTLKLSTFSGKRDQELNRLRMEKQELEAQLAKNREEVAKAKNASTLLQQDADERIKLVDLLRLQLKEKDGKLQTLQSKKKRMQDEVADLEKQKRRVDKLKVELADKQDNLERSKNQNSQLLISEKALIEMVESHRSRAETKEQAFLDLQAKLVEVQSALEGDHNKEEALMKQLSQLETDSREMSRKYQIELNRADEMKRENESLKAKLSGASDMTLQKSRRLREQLDEQMAMESKMTKENARFRTELSGIIAESGKNEQMYLALKKMYDEEKNGRQKVEDQQKIEQELQQRILVLEREEAEKDLRLKKAREFEEQKGYEITTTYQRLTQSGEEIKQIDLEIERLRQELSVISSDDTKRQDEDDIKYKTEISSMMGKVEEWRLKALASQKREQETRSEMEAQIKLMKSREEMVAARDQKIGHLKKAKRRVDGSVDISKAQMDSMFFGIQVTSVVDHRENHNHDVKFYKHERPLADYHDHILKVDHDPAFVLETELETLARRKAYEAAKKRKRTDRRPSMG